MIAKKQATPLKWSQRGNFRSSFSLFFSFCILSCEKENASNEESPKGISCECDKNGSMQALNASFVKEAESNCTAESGKIKKCTKNK